MEVGQSPGEVQKPESPTIASKRFLHESSKPRDDSFLERIISKGYVAPLVAAVSAMDMTIVAQDPSIRSKIGYGLLGVFSGASAYGSYRLNKRNLEQ